MTQQPITMDELFDEPEYCNACATELDADGECPGECGQPQREAA